MYDKLVDHRLSFFQIPSSPMMAGYQINRVQQARNANKLTGSATSGTSTSVLLQQLYVGTSGECQHGIFLNEPDKVSIYYTMSPGQLMKEMNAGILKNTSKTPWDNHFSLPSLPRNLWLPEMSLPGHLRITASLNLRIEVLIGRYRPWSYC